MTSIFSQLYLDNLDRINSSPQNKKSAKVGHQTEKADFANVLADVEKKAKKHGDPQHLAAHKTEAPQLKQADSSLLTNLNQTEHNYVRARLSSVPVDPPLRQNGVKTPQGIDPSSVKKQEEHVKLPAPEVVNAQRHDAPKAPVVVGAKRLSKRAAEQEKQAALFARGDIKNIVVTAGKYHGVDPALSLAVAQAESSYQHDAVSADGHYSKGLFQLLDSTANHMKDLSGIDEAYDPFDPGMNAFLGVGYLRRLMDMFSSSTKLNSSQETTPAKSSRELEKLAVAAFNAGEGSVVRAQEKARALGKNPALFASIEPHLPPSTREYVQRVTKIRENLAEVDEKTKTV